MLLWPRLVRQLSFRISGSPEPVRIYWLDQTKDIAIGPAPQTVSFDLGASYQGWALLPPSEIDSLSIESPAAQAGTYIIGGDVFAQPEQPVRLNRAQRASISANRIAWPGFKPINVRRPGALVLAWLCIFTGGMLAVAGFFRLSLYLSRARWFNAIQHMSSQSQLQPREEPGQFVRIALPVWSVCVLYHLVFVFSVGIGFTNDSVGYYDMARQFISAPSLQGIVVERTPGYPLFIAAVIWIFGNTVWAIALLQHLALASLSVVTIWCLWDRFPHKWAAAAGLLSGFAPAVSPVANILWTEALFCTLACSALLFASCYRRCSVYMLLAGLCAGGATMFRPNGLLLMVAIGGCLLSHFFWRRGERPLRAYTSAGLLLAGGYLMVAAPWHMHLAVNRHTLVLGKGLKEFGSWAGYVFQRQLPIDLAINRPDRAIYAEPSAYHDEPYVAKAEFPLIMGDEATYYRETEREWFASQSLAPYLEDLKYNATLAWRPVDLRFEFKEIRWFIEWWMQPAPPVTASGSETQRLFSDLTNHRPMAFQFARMPCLKFSELVLNHWIYIALFAGIGMLASFVCPWLLPITMFVAASVLAFSTNLIPGERYIAVLEPLYYVLGVAGVYSLWTVATYKSRRPESRTPGSQAALGQHSLELAKPPARALPGDYLGELGGLACQTLALRLPIGGQPCCFLDFTRFHKLLECISCFLALGIP
jgi:4-amino-4-deoxy-L-arabinose transferase-like glycosyltransferase